MDYSQFMQKDINDVTAPIDGDALVVERFSEANFESEYSDKKIEKAYKEAAKFGAEAAARIELLENPENHPEYQALRKIYDALDKTDKCFVFKLEKRKYYTPEIRLERDQLYMRQLCEFVAQEGKDIECELITYDELENINLDKSTEELKSKASYDYVENSKIKVIKFYTTEPDILEAFQTLKALKADDSVRGLCKDFLSTQRRMDNYLFHFDTYINQVKQIMRFDFDYYMYKDVKALGEIVAADTDGIFKDNVAQVKRLIGIRYLEHKKDIKFLRRISKEGLWDWKEKDLPKSVRAVLQTEFGADYDTKIKSMIDYKTLGGHILQFSYGFYGERLGMSEVSRLTFALEAALGIDIFTKTLPPRQNIEA